MCWDGQAALQQGEGGREGDFSHLFLLLPAALLAHAALPVALQASGCLQDGSSKGGPVQQPLKPAVSALLGIRWLFQVSLERQLNRLVGTGKPLPLVQAWIPAPSTSRATPCACGTSGNRAVQSCSPCHASSSGKARLKALPASLEIFLPICCCRLPERSKLLPQPWSRLLASSPKALVSICAPRRRASQQIMRRTCFLGSR